MCANYWSTILICGKTSCLSILRDDDLWMEAATDCLECCPKGSDVLDLSFTEDTDEIRKMRMFSAISEHYTKASPPLWPEQHFTDLQVRDMCLQRYIA